MYTKKEYVRKTKKEMYKTKKKIYFLIINRIITKKTKVI